MSEQRKSPLKFMPLPVAGESLNDAWHDGMVTEVFIPAMVALAAIIFAAMEWKEYFWPTPPRPLLMSVIAVGVVGWAAYRMRKAVPKLRDISLGRSGEVAVAQYLDRLRPEYRVIHDIPTGRGNIDHVIVGRKGVFTIETKTLRKPANGACTISYVDGAVLANGARLKRNPVKQAKAQAGWLGELLAQTQSRVPVWPVVAFPGWFVERFDQRKAGLWVIEPKALESFLANEPDRLTDEQVKLIGLALSAYIRSYSGKVTPVLEDAET